jgi:hypothetical protein
MADEDLEKDEDIVPIAAAKSNILSAIMTNPYRLPNRNLADLDPMATPLHVLFLLSHVPNGTYAPNRKLPNMPIEVTPLSHSNDTRDAPTRVT